MLSQETHTDIVFASVPYTAGRYISMAPALLKAIAQNKGHTAVGLDLNIEIVDWVESQSNRQQLEHAFNHAVIDWSLADQIHHIVDHCAQRILAYNPRVIGLSLLTQGSQLLTQWLCVHLRFLAPNAVILIGGSGIKNFIAGTNNQFCEFMLAQRLIDFYITGDGELALQNWLDGNYDFPGINSPTWQQLTDISNFAYPDYRDYRFDLYLRPEIALTDSRGCIKTCEFCDIIEHWKKYVWRTADSVFEEMLVQIERHDIRHFTMRNSLTNGNMKQFRRWLELIADFNRERSVDEQISWDGYFIVREADQHPEELWTILAKTNPMLIMGIESPVQRLRWNMGKKFSNEALDYHLHMAQRYGIDVLLLVIVASPTETREEFAETQQWFQQRLHYAKNPITGVSLAMASVLPNTEWERHQAELHITPGDYPVLWIDQTTRISPQERLEHFRQLEQTCEPFNREQKKLAYESNVHTMLDPLIETS